MIGDFINKFTGVLYTVISWVLDQVFPIVAPFIILLFKLLFKIVMLVLSTLDISGNLLNMGVSWGLLPPQMIWVINATGLSAGLSMIGSAYLIRITLNLIPSEITRV